ncbi:MAG: ATP-binding protein, partial [Ensifer adhaerens]
SWLPLQYYARNAGLSREALGTFIGQITAPPTRKKTYIARAIGNASAYAKAAGAAEVCLKAIEDGTISMPKSARQAAEVARAIIGLEQKPTLPLADLLKLLQECWNVLEATRPGWLTFVRKAVARVDEVFYGDDKRPTK